MQQKTATMALILFLAACGGDAGTDAGASELTTTTTVPTTTTTTAPSTTTTARPQPRLAITNTRFEPNAPYRAALLGGNVEFDLAFGLDGWKVEALGVQTGTFMHLLNHATDLDPGANIGLVSFMAGEPLSDLADWYRSRENVIEATEPLRTELGGRPALEFDLLLAPRGGTSRNPCGNGILTVDERTINGDPWREEIAACTWNRIWVVDVDGVAITAIVGAGIHRLDQDANPWRIADFETLIVDFVNAITFCTEATPCDD